MRQGNPKTYWNTEMFLPKVKESIKRKLLLETEMGLLKDDVLSVLYSGREYWTFPSQLKNNIETTEI